MTLILQTASLVLGMAMAMLAMAAERQATPIFGGEKLPDPPAQKQAWQIPPSTLPESYVTATRTLFDQGMADPRGGEYREIRVGTGDVWNGDGGVMETHGWLLPGDGPERFAVCWNGLIYPVFAAGEPADWRADAAAAIGEPIRRDGFVQPEPATVAWNTCFPIKGCLILRLGDPKLAEELWTAMQLANHRAQLGWWEKSPADSRGEKPEFAFDTTDPYQLWAADWAWSLFDRAICAHMRGDDRLALLAARKLDELRPRIVAEAERRRPERSLANNTEPVHYFGFLEPVSDLLKDQERRASQPRHAVALDVIKNGGTPQAERIELLIRDLDEFAVRQFGQPGGLGPVARDPIVAALIREGEPAIGPLLQCLESDASSHLTRSVSFGRDFHSDRNLHSLVTPIRDALLGIMKTRREAVGVSPRDIHDFKLTPKDEAARFRAYWQRFGSLPVTERWYRTLADDAAGKAAWIDAVEQLVGYSETPPLPGESLRSKSFPTVSELLVKRAEEFARDRSNWHNSNQGFHNSDTVRFIMTSMKWEVVPMLPLAKELMGSIITIYGANPAGGHRWQMDGRNLGELTVARASNGDADALQEWAGWIRNRLPSDIQNDRQQSLEPLIRFPDHPAIKSAAAELFAKPDSPWRSFSASRTDTLISLRVFPEIKGLMLELLNDTRHHGEAVVRENLGQTLTTPTVSRGWGVDPLLQGVAVGTRVTVRRCDEVAQSLSRTPGYPAFSFFWTEARRDQSITAMKKLLAMRGERESGP